jgi:hypothetical protein
MEAVEAQAAVIPESPYGPGLKAAASQPLVRSLGVLRTGFRPWNRLAAETTIARVDLSTDSGSIGPGR